MGKTPGSIDGNGYRVEGRRRGGKKIGHWLAFHGRTSFSFPLFSRRLFLQREERQDYNNCRKFNMAMAMQSDKGNR